MTDNLSPQMRDKILDGIFKLNKYAESGDYRQMVRNFLNSLTVKDEPCNQVEDKSCYNQDGKRCLTCEFTSLCLCTRFDRPALTVEDEGKKEHPRIQISQNESIPCICKECQTSRENRCPKCKRLLRWDGKHICNPLPED